MTKFKKMGNEPQTAGSRRATKQDILARVLELQHAAMLVLAMELTGPQVIKVDNLNNAVRSLLDSYWDTK